MPPDASAEGVPALLARLDATIAAQVSDRPFRLGYSVGTAGRAAAGDANSIDDLSARADAAMYADKQRKRDAPARRLNVIR